MDSFWEYFWLIFACFAFAAYVMVLFSILTDLFRDHTTSGWAKALWVFVLFVLPALGMLIYLIVRGHGMADRSVRAEQHYRQAVDTHIRDVAGTSPDRQVETARSLLDSGAITEEEYRLLETRARRTA